VHLIDENTQNREYGEGLVAVLSCYEYLGRIAEVRYGCDKRGLVPLLYCTLPLRKNTDQSCSIPLH
jgi:hypothetical protein